MLGQSKWGDGRQVALLFAATVVLPSLTLALLAWRALDSDRRLAEQVWLDRLQDSAKRVHAVIERRVLEARDRAEALARGDDAAATTLDGVVTAILTPELKLIPATRVAWIPDGRGSTGPPLPVELARAEARELQPDGTHEAAQVYASLFERTPATWRGWICLRLSRTLARAGEPARAAVALRQAARLPDSPGPMPTRFAARFELASTSPEEAASLYRDLNAGAWLLERSPYSFYEERLREWAGARLTPEILANEQRRQSISRLMDRVLNRESGWLTEGTVSALVTTASHMRAVAIITLQSRWEAWITEAEKELPRDVAIGYGAGVSPNRRYVSAPSLASAGLPWSIWAEPRDPAAPERANQGRRRLLLAILFFVAGVLVFGSFATVRIVQREIMIARLQSDFTATVSHEFRSPLTGIRQLAEMLMAGRAADDESRRRHYYELICRESQRLTRLVENVLDLSRIEDGRKQYHFTCIDTAEWLRGLAAIAGQRRSVEADLPSTLPPVQGDREALSSAVLNLLDNAIKYSPEGAPVGLRANADKHWVTIEIQDHGFGIAAGEQPHIFDRFYRGRNATAGSAKGVGLGLALVKRIADAHGARIRVESVAGVGSTFCLSLKASP